MATSAAKRARNKLVVRPRLPAVAAMGEVRPFWATLAAFWGQSGDARFQLGFCVSARSHFEHDALGADNGGVGEDPHAVPQPACELADFVASGPEGIRDRQLPAESRDPLALLGGNAEKLDSLVLPTCVQAGEAGHFLAAGAAPGRPAVKHQQPALESAQGLALAGFVLEGRRIEGRGRDARRA